MHGERLSHHPVGMTAGARSGPPPRHGNRFDGRRKLRIDSTSNRRLPERDTDRLEPAPDVPVDGGGAEWHLFVQRPFGRMEDERLGLWSAEATVRSDEL